MARNLPSCPENIYRTCRLRAEYSSQQKAVEAFASAGFPISEGSLKDYERDRRIPTPQTVIKMAEIYGTPELKYLHCSESCPLGQQIAKIDPTIGVDDIYRTYFELIGAFDRVNHIQKKLHDVIADNDLKMDELPAMVDILEVLDQIAESSKEIRIWAERERTEKTDVDG